MVKRKDERFKVFIPLFYFAENPFISSFDFAQNRTKKA